MIEYEEKTEVVKIPVKYICDVCGKKIDNDFEAQELVSLNFIGGYSSVFGDSVQVKCDICQECLFGFIGDCARYNEDVETW